jgi:predicted transcriptional regulator
VARVLGPLETEVIEEVWRQGETTTIRRVWDALRRQRPMSFNTVMTVMNRLAEKGILIRRGQTGSYRFFARVNREVFLAGVSKAIAAGLIRDFGDYAVAEFVAALREADPEKLEELRRTVAAAGKGRSDPERSSDQ